MKPREESWKYDVQQSIFGELWGVSSVDETLCRMLDIIAFKRQTFLLAHRRWGCWGRFTRRNVCVSVTEIPYWWRWINVYTIKSSSHGVPNTNSFIFRFLLVNFGKVLCSSANKLQQNSNASSREEDIPQILAVLLEIHRVYIWPLWPFVCHS